MKLIQAIWIPAWHELDQNISVGETTEFSFIENESPIRFATGLDNYSISKVAKIISIFNSQLGNLIKIDCGGLSYKFFSNQNTYTQIEAEENPGKIEYSETLKGNLEDKIFRVKIEVARS